MVDTPLTVSLPTGNTGQHATFETSISNYW